MSRSASSLDIEAALTHHYLRSDGPYGGAPLRFLDVTETELQRALEDILHGEKVRGKFIKSFDPRRVRGAFVNGVCNGIAASGETPGCFRYLVLSCVVFALDENEVESFDFGIRLNELLGINVPNRPGIRMLWERLRKWCDFRADKNLPFRRIVLPDVPHSMRNIGHSAIMTFPSWRDVIRLERLFQHAGRDELMRPAAVIGRVQSSLLGGSWSVGFKAAFQDFKAKHEQGLRLIDAHPFLQIARRTASLPQEAKHSSQWHLDLTTDVDGIDEFHLADSQCIDDFTCDDLGYALRRIDDKSVRGEFGDLFRCVKEGVVPFEQSERGGWSFCREPSTSSVRCAIRTDIIDKPNGMSHSPSSWTIENPMTLDRALALIARVRPRAAERGVERTIRPAWEGGVRVGTKAFLGRAGFLPRLAPAPGVSVEVMPRHAELGTLRCEIVDGVAVVCKSQSRLCGTWTVSLKERGEFAGDFPIAFLPEAQEHTFPTKREKDGWLAEAFLADGSIQTAVACLPTDTSHVVDHRIWDLLEAIYSRAASGWAERDLLVLLDQYFSQELKEINSAHSIRWDVLQILVASGWLRPLYAATWRARRWQLMAPRLVAWPNTGCVLLDGAAGEIVRRRFETSVRARGGRVIYVAGSGFAIPLPVADIRNLDGLSEDMGLQLEVADAQVPLPGAPFGLKTSLYSDLARHLRAKWCWTKKSFVTGSSMSRTEGSDGISLSLLRHNADRSPDIYIVHGGKLPDSVFESRGAALVEAHRRAEQPLFEIDAEAGLVVRTGRAGYLPEEVERWLRLATLRGPWLTIGNGAWRWTYPVRPQDAMMLAQWLGTAATLVPRRLEASSGRSIDPVVLARRRRISLAAAKLVRRSA